MFESTQLQFSLPHTLTHTHSTPVHNLREQEGPELSENAGKRPTLSAFWGGIQAVGVAAVVAAVAAAGVLAVARSTGAVCQVSMVRLLSFYPLPLVAEQAVQMWEEGQVEWLSEKTGGHDVFALPLMIFCLTCDKLMTLELYVGGEFS